MKRTKPKMKMFPYGNNPARGTGPGREQAEKEAKARRKQLAKSNQREKSVFEQIFG